MCRPSEHCHTAPPRDSPLVGASSTRMPRFAGPLRSRAFSQFRVSPRLNRRRRPTFEQAVPFSHKPKAGSNTKATLLSFRGIGAGVGLGCNIASLGPTLIDFRPLQRRLAQTREVSLRRRVDPRGSQGQLQRY
jgi:hypothetical protein